MHKAKNISKIIQIKVDPPMKKAELVNSYRIAIFLELFFTTLSFDKTILCPGFCTNFSLLFIIMICQGCNLSFEKVEELNEHVIEIHKIIECCGLNFTGTKELKEHGKSSHKRNKLCNFCFKFWDKNLIVLHRRLCGGSDPEPSDKKKDEKIEELLKEIKDLKKEIEFLKNENFSLKTKLLETQSIREIQNTGIKEAHLNIYGTQICTDDNKTSFKDVIQRITSNHGEASRNRFKKLWADFFDDFLNFDQEYSKSSIIEGANNYFIKKKNLGKTSSRTLNIYARIIQTILQEYYKDKSIKLQMFSNIQPSKGKYKFTEKETENMLEYLRFRFETKERPLEKVLFCSIVAYHGRRGKETLHATAKNFLKLTKVLNILDTKNNTTAILKLADLHALLIDGIIKKNKNCATIWGLDLGVTRLMRYYMTRFPNFVDHESIIEKKLGIGIHCFRKTKINTEFEDIWKKTLEETQKITGHLSAKTLESYVNLSDYQLCYRDSLKCLSNFTDIGKQKIFIPWEAKGEQKDINFKISRNYAEFYLGTTCFVCPVCYFIVENEARCKICGDHFHMTCTKEWDNNVCINCQYFKEGKYLLRTILLDKNNIKCVFCEKTDDTYYCRQCVSEKEKKYKRTPKRRNFGSCTVPKEENEFGKKTLKIALEKQGLKFYSQNYCNFCIESCDCNLAKNCLNNVYLNKKDIENLSAPIAIDWDADAGFYVFATGKIKQNTIITEYIGDIIHKSKIYKTDSCMTLVESGNELNNVFIAPVKGGNFGKFIAGHKDNNNLTVTTITLEDRVHVYLFANRSIEKGEVLYYYYGDKYPMKNFKMIERSNATEDEICKKLKDVEVKKFNKRLNFK